MNLLLGKKEKKTYILTQSAKCDIGRYIGCYENTFKIHLPPPPNLEGEGLGRLSRKGDISSNQPDEQCLGKEDGGGRDPVTQQQVQEPEGRGNTACPRLRQFTVFAATKVEEGKDRKRREWKRKHG